MSNTEVLPSTNLAELTAEIVAAYVANNSVPTANLADLIETVHRSVSGLLRPAEPVRATHAPAINPKRSVHPDHIICLEDGKRFKSLKRHLMTHYGQTPDEYRAKWGLPRDYPMVAPNYAAARSALAKKMELGRKAKEPAKPRGRKK